MDVKLIYSTPDYHKLVETVMRICYQSYDKETESSHKSIRAIIAKGHLSIASVGNMVFEIDVKHSSYYDALEDLSYMQEINQFIKWTTPFSHKSSGKFYVSMNMLTFLDLYKQLDNEATFNETFTAIFERVQFVDQLRWFYDKKVELPDSPNVYSAKGCPKLYEPIVLDEDYTNLKALGLNDYELGIHSTITMNFVTDRSTSLQLWRHWSGGCELSQRYVERGNADFREMLGIEDEGLKGILDEINKQTKDRYGRLLDLCEKFSIRKGRAKEIARSILPNSITTQLIQCRPYRNWMHLFKLRDDKHAQVECQQDIRAIKKSLREMGVKVD